MSLQSQLNSFVLRVAQRFSDIEQRIAQVPGGNPGGAAAFLHTQVSPASIWTINHNLGFRPVVTILDSGGSEVTAAITHTSQNQLLVRFAIPMAGQARLI